MRCFRPLIWAILVYIALDASVLAMPGSFAFDPEDCIDGHQTGVSRWALRSLVATVPDSESSFPVPLRIDNEARVVLVRPDAPRDHRERTRALHIKLDPVPSSEDPL